MADTDMCFTLPNLEPVGSEFSSLTNDVKDEADSLAFVIPHPSPADLNHLQLIHSQSHDVSKQKQGHIPRPRNAFILFRCDFVRQRVPEAVINNHRDLSRLAGCMWRKMTEVQKRPWFEKAEVEKRYHSEVFPEYRYSPVAADRPKRIYRRKKPPVPDEILLTYPHRRRSESGPRVSQTANGSNEHSSLASFSMTAPGLPPSALIYDDEHTEPFKRQGFPQSYTRHHSEILPLSLGAPDNLDQTSFNSPGPYCGGFVGVPKRHSSAEVDWEFSPSDSIVDDQHGYWSTSEVNRMNSFEINSTHDSDMASIQEQDSLYGVWKDLEMLHDQAYQQSADQEVMAVGCHRYPHDHGLAGNHYGPSQNDAPLLHHPYPQRVESTMTLDRLSRSP